MLDAIPRYGRLYSMDSSTGDIRDRRNWKVEWCYQRYGNWGSNLLSRCNMLWEFFDEYELRLSAKRAVRLEQEKLPPKSTPGEVWAVVVIGVLLISSVATLILGWNSL